jgi:hypothetical protein
MVGADRRARDNAGYGKGDLEISVSAIGWILKNDDDTR